MGDRTDEVTAQRSSRSTEEIIDETDQLLSNENGSNDTSTPKPAGTGSEPTQTERSKSTVTDESESTSSSRLSRLTPSVSGLAPTEYFSPKAFVAIFALLSVGLVIAAFTVPIAGRVVGLFLTAFLIGLIASKRRYLELGTAGIAAGAAATVIDQAFLTVLGFGQALVAIGAGVGLLSCLIGYYFGRDLRDGLQRDIDRS